jgi:hypothetical protein
LSARWKQEKSDDPRHDPVDEYVVTGRIRRKKERASSSVTLRVEMRTGPVRMADVTRSIEQVKFNQPQYFEVTVEDGTHARTRPANLNFVVSVEQDPANEVE